MKHIFKYLAITLTLFYSFSCNTSKQQQNGIYDQLFVSVSTDYAIIFDVPQNKNQNNKLSYEIKFLPSTGCPPCPRDSILITTGKLKYALNILKDSITIRSKKHNQNKISIDILDSKGKTLFSYDYIKNSDNFYYPLGNAKPIDKQAVENYINLQNSNNTIIFGQQAMRGCNPRIGKC